MNRIVLLLIVVLGQSVMADVDHNIKGAFGDRAAGMSGAYTAVSDDASGAYYNPAGLGCEWKVETDIGRKTETDIHRRRNGR